MPEVKTWIKTARINWKPLVGGLVAGLPAIINAISPVLPPEYQAVLTGLGIIWMGIFGKQKNVTGGDVQQKM